MRVLRIPRPPTGVLVVGAVYIVSRAVLIAAGMPFDSSLTPWLEQLLDVRLLEHHLVQSVWNLHSQPPLFNLEVGVALKLFPHHLSGAFRVFFLALGLPAALALEQLLERFAFRRATAIAAASLISCAPWWLVYENWLYYEYPVMCMLVLAAFALAEFGRTHRRGWGVACFSLLALVIYTRASFQIVWLLVVLALVLVAPATARRRLLQAAALPVLLVVLLYAKQLAQFGVPSTTSWFGMNLARITLNIAPAREVQPLVDEGKLSRIALVKPFAALPQYEAEGVPAPRHTGIPALDEVVKANGSVNLNNIAYVDLSRRYLRQSLLFIRYRPRGYLRGIGKAVGKLSVPATDYSYVFPERAQVRSWDRIFNAVVYWRTPWAHGVGFGLPVLYILDALWGAALLLRVARRRVVPAWTGTALFLWATIVYLLLLASLTDYGENQRVHLPIDPLVLVLAAVGVRDIWRRRVLSARTSNE